MTTESTPTILVIDDSVEILSLLSKLLGSQYQVRAALSGESGLKAAECLPKPDLILLDVMMPGMDGYEVMARLRQNAVTQDIPVILLTALANPKDEEHGLELGAADYIAKPINPAVMLVRVRTQLENKQARDLLKEQNVALRQKLSSIMNSVDVVVWSAEPDTFKLLYINTSVSRLTGYTDQELLAKPGLRLDMILPEDRERVAEAFGRTKADGTFDCDYRIHKPDGSLCWISDHGRTVYDNGHHAIRIDGVATDITERRINEIAKEAIDLMSKDFLCRLPTPDLLGRITAFLSDHLRFPIAAIGLRNPAQEQIQCFGCIGNPAGSPMETPPCLADIAMAVSETGQVWCVSEILPEFDALLSALGEFGGQSLLCLPLRVGEAVLGALILADRCRRPDVDELAVSLSIITEHLALELDRRRTAGILDRQARYLRTLIDSLPIFVSITTPEGMIIDVNQTSLRAAGISFKDVIGQHFEDTYWWSHSTETQDRIKNAIANASNGQEVRFTARAKVSEDRCILVDYAIAPMRAQDGQITHLIHTGVDVSKSLEMEEKLRNELRRWERRAEICFKACDGGLALVDPDSGHCIKANPALCSLLGYTADELPGLTLAEIARIGPTEPESIEWEQLLRGKTESNAGNERRNCRLSDGTAIVLDVTVDHCLNEAGEVEAILACFRPESRKSPPANKQPSAKEQPR